MDPGCRDATGSEVRACEVDHVPSLDRCQWRSSWSLRSGLLVSELARGRASESAAGSGSRAHWPGVSPAVEWTRSLEIAPGWGTPSPSRPRPCNFRARGLGQSAIGVPAAEPASHLAATRRRPTRSGAGGLLKNHAAARAAGNLKSGSQRLEPEPEPPDSDQVQAPAGSASGSHGERDRDSSGVQVRSGRNLSQVRVTGRPASRYTSGRPVAGPHRVALGDSSRPERSRWQPLDNLKEPSRVGLKSHSAPREAEGPHCRRIGRFRLACALQAPADAERHRYPHQQYRYIRISSTVIRISSTVIRISSTVIRISSTPEGTRSSNRHAVREYIAVTVGRCDICDAHAALACCYAVSLLHCGARPRRLLTTTHLQNRMKAEAWQSRRGGEPRPRADVAAGVSPALGRCGSRGEPSPGADVAEVSRCGRTGHSSSRNALESTAARPTAPAHAALRGTKRSTERTGTKEVRNGLSTG
jgi:hypothetical protein